MNGVTSFNPKDFQKGDSALNFPFRIIGFTQFNVKTNTVDDRIDKLNFENEIAITDDDKFSTLYFSLLDFEDWEHSYAYKIEGLHNDWISISENKIQLSDLPYGKYSLTIKARLVNGNWNKQEIKLRLTISRPFYKNKWFVLVMVLVLLFAIYLFIKLRLYFLKKENEKLENIVSTRTSELKVSLNEKTALIQEIHHRVKNNLQFIEAMLEMQVSSSKNTESQGALLSTSRRINAMILVHEMLYTKNNLESISLKRYLTELVSKIDEVINDNKIPIRFKIEVEDVNFNITDCVAIGMITSEILSNSIKYAFNGVNEPQISVLLGYLEKDKVIIYKVKDNGKGFEKTDTNSGFGLRLIDIFTRQLKGSYAIKNNNGLSFIFEFKHDKTDNSSDK